MQPSVLFWKRQKNPRDRIVKQFLKWILLFFTLLALKVAYDLFLKYELSDYKAGIIGENIVVNFNENERTFNDIKRLVEGFSGFDHLSFIDNNKISLQVSINQDSLSDYDLWIDIEENSVFYYDSIWSIKDLEKLVKHSMAFDTFHIPKWTISYKGSTSSKPALLLLSSININQKKLSHLKDKLNEVDCKAVIKKDAIVSLLYRGHDWDGFFYRIPLHDSINRTNWAQLRENIYW